MSTTTEAPPSNKTGGSAGSTATKTANNLIKGASGGGGTGGSPLIKALGEMSKSASKMGAEGDKSAPPPGAGNKDNPKQSRIRRAGKNAAGKLNSLRDKVKEKALETAGESIAGPVGAKIGKALAKLHTWLNKKLTGNNEEARFLLETAEAMGPAAPIIIGVVGFMVLIIVLIMSIFGGTASGQPLLTITKSGPASAAMGATLNYYIKVSYSGTAQDVIITDPIPAGTAYDVSTPPPAQFDPATGIVTWDLKTIVPPQNGLIGNFNTTLALKLTATEDKKILVNQAQGVVIGEVTLTSSGGSSVGGYNAPAPAYSCSSKYANYISRNYLLPENYGDPQCNFSKDALYSLLKQQDPQFADIWYYTIIPGESGYNPNAWAAPVGSQLSLDAQGAWGFYQMGSSNPPGKAPPAPGKNGPLDRGDINWETQTANAIGYNKNLRCNFRYWATAQGIWGKYSC